MIEVWFRNEEGEFECGRCDDPRVMSLLAQNIVDNRQADLLGLWVWVSWMIVSQGMTS